MGNRQWRFLVNRSFFTENRRKTAPYRISYEKGARRSIFVLSTSEKVEQHKEKNPTLRKPPNPEKPDKFYP